MKLPGDRTDHASLSSIGSEAARLFASKQYHQLASEFGYALSGDRPTADALHYDVRRCLADDGRHAMLDSSVDAEISVSYFTPNESSLFALVECFMPLEGDPGSMLVELIVTTSGNDRSICVEDITYAPPIGV